MDVRIDAARGHDLSLARNHLGSRADHHPRRDARHHVGIARLADLDDPPATNTDIRLDNSPVIHDDRAGDHQVEGLIGRRCTTGLPHPVPQDFPAAEFRFLAVDGEIALNLDKQIGIGETDPVSRGRAIKVGILFAGNSQSSVRRRAVGETRAQRADHYHRELNDARRQGARPSAADEQRPVRL